MIQLRDGRRAGTALVMVAGLALALVRTATAGDQGAGTRAASFLAVSPSPGVQGMAGAGLALRGGLQSAHFNTASLADLGGFGASVSHATLEAGVSQDWMAMGGVLGRGWRWGADAVYRNEGSYDVRDENGNDFGTEAARSVAMSVQLARPVSSWLVLGGAARYVGEHLGTVHGNGLAFDAGATARLGAFSVALAGKNFGGGMDWEGQRWRMPATLGLGAAVDDPASGMRLAVDLVAPSNYFFSVRTGIEWRVQNLMALRAGYRHELQAPEGERLGGASFGLGTGWNGLWMDYSFSTGTDDLAQHRVALSLVPRRASSFAAGAGAAQPFGPPLAP